MSDRFILPIGEHLLKIVEQLEMVVASTGEGLQKVVVEAGDEWRSVLTEMERYGRDEEKKAMKASELVLKRGNVGQGGWCEG